MSDKEEKPKRQTLRERVLTNLSVDGFDEGGREIPVVARMNKRTVEILDSLVALDVFKSRSEAAAALVEGAISSREGFFEEIRQQAASLNKRQEAAMRAAQAVILERLK